MRIEGNRPLIFNIILKHNLHTPTPLYKLQTLLCNLDKFIQLQLLILADNLNKKVIIQIVALLYQHSGKYSEILTFL